MKLLNSIGFVWNAHDAAWEERFNELVKFRANNGHTNVPQPIKKGPRDTDQLGTWVRTQRNTLGKKLSMPNNTEKENQRIEKLNNLDFNWG
jgi:hypothetical protein